MKPPGLRMLLIDSSLWIEYYRPDGLRRRREAILEVLIQDVVATSATVTVEVLRGATNPENYDALRRDFSALRWLESTRAAAEHGGRIGFDLRRRGEIVPATDLLIAATAIEHGCELWHLGAHFERIAKVSSLKQRRFA